MVRRVEITGLILIYNMAVRLTGPRTDLVTTYVRATLRRMDFM